MTGQGRSPWTPTSGDVMKDEKHNHNTMLRLDEALHAKLEAWADGQGLPRAVAARGLLAKVLAGESIKSRRAVNLDTVRMIAELRAVGNNLNQAVRLLHLGTPSDAIADDVRRTLETLRQLMAEILDAIGTPHEP